MLEKGLRTRQDAGVVAGVTDNTHRRSLDHQNREVAVRARHYDLFRSWDNVFDLHHLQILAHRFPEAAELEADAAHAGSDEDVAVVGEATLAALAAAIRMSLP